MFRAFHQGFLLVVRICYHPGRASLSSFPLSACSVNRKLRATGVTSIMVCMAG